MKIQNKRQSVENLVRAAMLAATVFLMTRFLMVPLPVMGYIHLGDCAVMAAGVLLPLPFSAVAVAFGAALADATAGYLIYVPITLLTKAAMTLAFDFGGEKLLSKRNIFAAVFAVIINAAGYYMGEVILYRSFVSPLASIPFNLVQSAVGALIFAVFCIFVDTKPNIRKIFRGR